MFSSTTILAVKNEVAKAYDYWALSNEVQKVQFVLLPDKVDFHFGKLDCIQDAFNVLGLGVINPKQSRAECITSIFNKMSETDLIKQLKLFYDFLESDHFLNRGHFSVDEKLEDLNKDQLVCLLCNMTCIYRGAHAPGALSFKEGFKMRNHAVLKEFFAKPIGLKNELYGNNNSFDKLLKNVLEASGNDHMLKNFSFFSKVIKNGVFQFLSPMHLRTLISAVDSVAESENSLFFFYMEMQKLFQSILECFDAFFIEYEGFWLEKERFTLEELNKYSSVKRIMVTPDIEIVNKKAKIHGDFKVGNIHQKNGEYNGQKMVGHTLLFDKDEVEGKKNIVVELKDKERGYVEKQNAKEERVFSDSDLDNYCNVLQDEMKNRQMRKAKQAKKMENIHHSPSASGFVEENEEEKVALQNFESSLAPPHNLKIPDDLKELTDAERSVIKQIAVKPSPKMPVFEKEQKIFSQVKNPYITFNRNTSPKKATPTKEIKITGVRVRRSNESAVDFGRTAKKDTRSFEILVGFPVKSSERTVQDDSDGSLTTLITWKFCVCIRAMNSSAKGKSWFEMKPEVNVNVHELVYGMWHSNHKLYLGSSNVYTHCIVEGVKRVVPIRISPDIDEPLETTTNNGRDIPTNQMAGICELELTSDQNISSEITKVIDEYKNMIHDHKYKSLFRMAMWWTYVNANETNPAEIVRIIKSEDYPEALYERSIGNHTGGVYPYLVRDKGRVLSKVLPKVEVNAKVGCALNEMFLNSDIRKTVKKLIGEYCEEYKSFVFKDPENNSMTNYRKGMLRKAVKQRNLRNLEKNTPHHKMFLRNDTKRGKTMRSFFAKSCYHLEETIFEFCNRFRDEKANFTRGTRVKTILYFILLLACCAGISNLFENPARDPFMSKSISSCRSRTQSIIEEIKRKDQIIPFSQHVEEQFMNSGNARQREIINTLDFEQKNADIQFFKCASCRGKYFWSGGFENARSLCQDCESDGITKKDLLDQNSLPVWYDKEGNLHEELPKCMEDLTFGEMLCIQKVAFLFPTTHLKYGRRGLSGHTVMFMKDMLSVCTELPRSQVEVMTLIRNYTKNGEIKEQRFNIRKSKVLEVLRFLKEHHPSYEDITINETNLDWTGDEENGTVLQCAEIEQCEGNNEEEFTDKETVAKDQTEIDGDLIETYGLAMNEAIDKYNPHSKDILKALKMQTKQANLSYPQVQEKPVDEYLYQNVFADAYPWLFPGGLGDISNLVHNNKSNAIKWTRRLLHYHDGRFARDPSICFHLMNYLQRHINNRDSLFFIKDNYHTKNKTVDDLREQVANGDMSFVRNIQNFASYNIRGSDPWWRSRKHELDSWISHHLNEKNGPPTLFMTFSCAEFWWKDLKEFLIKRCQNTIDHDKAVKLKIGTKEEQKKIQIELVEKYSYCVQQFFELRMDNWLETIGKNVFQIKHYYLRFEFTKGRGQIHAHMLAITRDYHFIAKYYNEQKKDQFVGAKVYSEYARNRLSLTAEKENYDPVEMKSLDTISSRFAESNDVKEDLSSLIETCHIHKCNPYCLRQKKKGGVRECRAGCGKEIEPKSERTPGFPLQPIDTIDLDYKRQIKILKLKRNDPRMTQTSTTMLQSWRANCDLSVIVYDTDPAKLCPQDIARISGYIVSYCTKGNASYKKEQEAISKVIAEYDDDLLCDDEKTSEMHILKLSRRILNSFSSTRIISRAEACAELLSLDLFWCTESFSHVRLSKASKLHSSYDDESSNKSDKIDRYLERSDEFEEMNLHDFISYCSESKRRALISIQSESQLFRLRKTQHALKREILHGVGLNGHPHVPVTDGYAKSTLLLYKPWSRKAKLEFDMNPTLLFSEFFSFLGSDKCPLSVILSYLIAMENHERNERCGNVEDNDVVYDGSGCYDKNLNEYFEALQTIQLKDSSYSDCYRGFDGLYDFHKQHCSNDFHNKDFNWLYEQKEKYFETEKGKKKKMNINERKSRIYNNSDVSNNLQQETILVAIIDKLKEWLEFPAAHEMDPSVSFQPLLLTVRGEAGTGKSHVIKVVTNAVERIFDVKVSITCAPTGNAAFNVNGKTCHSFFGLDLEPGQKSTLSQTKQLQLKESLLRLLMVIIDERSLLSCEDLAKIHSNCCSFALGAINNHLPWGGIPIVVLFGDDKQLPAVMNNNRGGGVTTIFNINGFENHQQKESKLHKEGQRLFKQLSQRVITLKKNCRINDGNQFLQNCCNQLRDGTGLSKNNAKKLLEYRFENPKLSNQRRDELIKDAIWIFTTNREVDVHNMKMVEKMVNRQNPLISTSYKMYSRDGKRKFGIKSHFRKNDLLTAPVSFCRGSRVSIDRNLWQEVGLFNGALGTVVDIRYKAKKSPLLGDFPAYVIVDMDFYTGPIWDSENPNRVPIPIAERFCKKGCCAMESIPLLVSFARTLHKFQGQQVGPNHSNKMMVFGPGSSTFEASSPGLLYVGLSRMSTIGPSVNDSCFYFFGPDANENRLTNVTHKRGDKSQPTREKYKRVVLREVWERYLDRNERNFPFRYNSDERSKILSWSERIRVPLATLDNIISYHSHNRNG